MTKKSYVVMISACLILLIALGQRQSFGLFLGPISHDLGFGVKVFSFSIAAQMLLWGISQPFVGVIADKWGSGRTIAISGLVYVVGLLMIAFADSQWDIHAGAGLLIGLAGSGCTFAVVLSAVARHVPQEQRSVAFGIATAAATAGQVIVAPLSQLLISQIGWSNALLVLAGLIALIIPLAAPLTGRASDMTEASAGADSVSAAVAEARSHSGFLLLTAGFFVCGFQVFFLSAHLPNLLTMHGYPNLGGWALATIGLSNGFGSYLAGWLGARYSKKGLLAGLYLLRSLAFVIFLLMPINVVTVLTFSAIIGFLWLGTVPLTNGLIGQIFGIKYLATLSGIVFASHQLGAFLSIFGGGVLFDATGSYDVVFYISIALGVVAALLHMPIKDAPVVRGAMPAQ